MTCDAKIRPFPNPTEVTCESDEPEHLTHHGVLRDYAYPGSETAIDWEEDDRRTFRGTWAPCSLFPPCILPNGHRGRHAV